MTKKEDRAEKAAEEKEADRDADKNLSPTGLPPVTNNNQKIGAQPGSMANVESDRVDFTKPVAGQTGGNAGTGPAGGPVANQGASGSDLGSKAPATAPGNDTAASARGEGLGASNAEIMKPLPRDHIARRRAALAGG